MSDVVGRSRITREKLHVALIKALSRGKSPGAVAYVADLDTVFFYEAQGFRQLEPEAKPARKDTIYDLASLTKVVATTTAIFLLRNDGLLDLDQPVSEYVPIPAFSQFTLRHLLTHTSGLPQVKPLYEEATSLDEMAALFAEMPLDAAPGTRRRYSDAGFMILGKVVELAAMDSLDAFCRKRIFGPLQMTQTSFRPPEAWAEQCAATERCPWRGRVILGEVHDENAYAVGGVAGHAGLFSTAGDLAKFCRALLRNEILPEETVTEMTRLNQAPCFPWQGLGWQLDPWGTGEGGYLPSRAAFGHTGWTGTSIWIDRETGLFVLLLSNSCHPSRETRDNGALRRTFHTAVSELFYPNATSAHTGLDRLVHEGFEPVRGKRIALLTNHAAIDQFGRHILDVFALATDTAIQFLYTPEHGLRGQLEAGVPVESETGPIPVISLYGEQKEPSPEQLDRIDLFVVDLQDIGARYYTYMATMQRCMAACANAGKPVLVLDRPNPLGGLLLEGPVATNTGPLVCCAPIPVRHGMTMGELALFFRDCVPHTDKLDLAVLQLDNWTPERLFSECSLSWIAPSPNIPTPETALLYVGMCLFEGTNLNEGRGTDTPFAAVGAPWLDANAILSRIQPEDRPGCSLEPIAYTPRSIPGKAQNPRFCDLECTGIRIGIDKPRDVRAFTLAIALITAIRQVHPNEFVLDPYFDTLAGTNELGKLIREGRAAADIIAAFESALREFDAIRPRLYTPDPDQDDARVAP